MLEIEDHPLRLQRVHAEHAGGAEIDARQSGRLDVLHRPLADPEALDDHGRDLADLGHAVHGRGLPRPEREIAGQLARHDGPLGAGVDDEIIGAVPGDVDRHRHPRVRIDAVIERLGRALIGDLATRPAAAGARLLLPPQRRRQSQSGGDPRIAKRAQPLSFYASHQSSREAGYTSFARMAKSRSTNRVPA